jgi:plasmid stabilization system protein ParE
MKRVVFLSSALTEMTEAAAFYDAQALGLGEEFLDTIDRAVEDIQQHPRRWPVIARGVRRRLVGRFPHGVLYREATTQIVVVAIMHLHRRPDYWVERL